MRYIYTFLIMFGFWILLSGKFDLFHLTLGVISSGLVSFMSADLFMYNTKGQTRLSTGLHFLLYIPWLLYQIALSTLHVTFLALHPKMKDRELRVVKVLEIFDLRSKNREGKCR